MPLTIRRDDIFNIKCDAIVIPTDSYFSHSGSIDKKAYEMIGNSLNDYAKKLNVGEAILCNVGLKKCDYLIFACGPIYNGGQEEDLKKTYENCLKLALDNNLKSMAFPLISSGTFKYPKGKALTIATNTISEFLLNNEMNIYLLVYDNQAFAESKKIFDDVQDYIDEYIEIEKDNLLRSSNVYDAFEELIPESSVGSKCFKPDLSFGEYLIKLIDERQLKDSIVYKKANINRDVFNKIVNNKVKKPKKKTCVALAIALELNLEETYELLDKAGYTLSNSFVFDLIIKYAIDNKIYNIYDINEILFQYDQELLG